MTKIMTITRFHRIDNEEKFYKDKIISFYDLTIDEQKKLGRQITKRGISDFYTEKLLCYVSTILGCICIRGYMYVKYNLVVCYKG